MTVIVIEIKKINVIVIDIILCNLDPALLSSLHHWP